MVFAALACMIRPTNAIIWVFLFGNVLWALRLHRRALSAVVYEAVAIGYFPPSSRKPLSLTFVTQRNRLYGTIYA